MGVRRLQCDSGRVGKLLGGWSRVSDERGCCREEAEKVMSGDVDRTVRALVALLDSPPDPATRNQLSPILCVLTVLLSLDKRKPGYVEERVTRLQNPDPGYNTLVGIRTVVGNPDDGCLTANQYFRMDLRDDGKRAGLLLPLLDALIDQLRDFPAATEAAQAQAWATAASPSDWTFGPFRGLGLAGFQRLRVLFGANTVGPSKEIVAFVSTAVGRPMDAPEAVYLLERAAARLRYDLRAGQREVWIVKT